MPDISFRPRAGRFGLVPCVTTHAFGANPFTANSTVTVSIPSPPGKCYPMRARVHCTTVGADADGTMTIQLIKRKASDDTDYALTTAFNVEGLTTKEKSALAFTSTVTYAQRKFLEEDRLEADLVSNSAGIDTQPTELILEVEWAILE